MLDTKLVKPRAGAQGLFFAEENSYFDGDSDSIEALEALEAQGYHSIPVFCWIRDADDGGEGVSLSLQNFCIPCYSGQCGFIALPGDLSRAEAENIAWEEISKYEDHINEVKKWLN